MGCRSVTASSSRASPLSDVRPFKCPVAPLEFAFLADWHFHERGMRDRVEIVYATPLSDAFTKPVASPAARARPFPTHGNFPTSMS